LGYNPKKEGSRISFKHDKHNKQIAKVGVTRGKAAVPFFRLRFSACREYSQKFADAVQKEVENSDGDGRNCLTGPCDYCAGEPITHVYIHTYPDERTRMSCGAIALTIPNLTAKDAVEIKRLLKEEHTYLMRHQAGIEVT
jgi:hypothetical protein